MLTASPCGVVIKISGADCKSLWQAPEVGHSSGDTSGSAAMSPDDVESMLLMAVDKLYREDREVDVQLGLLSVVLQVLQRHGMCML